MGNQALLKINPCSEDLIEITQKSRKAPQIKISKFPNLEKVQSEKKPTSIPKILKKAATTHRRQSQETNSTEGSSVKNSEPRLSPFTKKILLESQKIIENKLANNSDSSKSKKIFIFDWDDTLFFSSHLKKQKVTNSSITMSISLRHKFDQSANNILKSCIQMGQVYIVTNSKEGWVKYSSELFMPKTAQTIFKNEKIKVISSRPTQEQFFMRTAPSKWKYCAFIDIMQRIMPLTKRSFFQQQDLHLICVGDSQQQIEASNSIYEMYHHQYQNLFVKTIKLQDFPNIEDLMEEQELFYEKLEMIANINKKLVIKLERPKKSKN